MKTIESIVAILLLAAALSAQPIAGQDTSAEHQAGVNTRGDHVMGFSHEKTTHHFWLFKDGGAIQVDANDPKDTESRDMVRMHLSHIAKMFSSGDFNAPMLIHGTTPPGVPTMTELREQIRYEFEKSDAGGRVRIRTANPEALAAIFEFLRFQIAEHETGDSTEVTPEPGASKHK